MLYLSDWQFHARTVRSKSKLFQSSVLGAEVDKSIYIDSLTAKISELFIPVTASLKEKFHLIRM